MGNAGTFRRRHTWIALVLMIGTALAGCEGTEGTNFGFEPQTTSNTDFHPPFFYPVGNFPISLAVADYEGDGDLDVAITNSFESTPGDGSGTISILVNNGEGVFSTLTNLPAGSVPGQVVFADLNGSPPLDLAYFTASNAAVGLLLDGATAPPLVFLNGTGLKFSALDLDGDGDNDLIASVVNPFEAGPGMMVVLKNDGTGVLTRIDPDLAVASPTNPGTPGDFVTGHWNPGTGPDQDDFLDLAVLNVSNNVVALFLGRGDGNFDPALHLIAPTLDSIVPTLSGPFSIVTGHWNPGQDNLLDLAISSSGDPSVTVFLSQGNGVFLPGPNSPIRLPANPGEIQKMITGLFT
ncbi:MAG: VCBS repeat-containing protein, partial [SAR324 cluster bacterium]|nr:VCBS repeat-containing protein [SAR324 cluster bacterium]